MFYEKMGDLSTENEITIKFSGAQYPILLITCVNHVYEKTTVTSFPSGNDSPVAKIMDISHSGTLFPWCVFRICTNPSCEKNVFILIFNVNESGKFLL
jgi:hypothetical protein